MFSYNDRVNEHSQWWWLPPGKWGLFRWQLLLWSVQCLFSLVWHSSMRIAYNTYTSMGWCIQMRTVLRLKTMNTFIASFITILSQRSVYPFHRQLASPFIPCTSQVSHAPLHFTQEAMRILYCIDDVYLTHNTWFLEKVMKMWTLWLWLRSNHDSINQ